MSNVGDNLHMCYGSRCLRRMYVCTMVDVVPKKETKKGKGRNDRINQILTNARKNQRENAHDKERVCLANIFVDQLDKVPSHYCRKSSTKKYLWPYDFKSAQDVYTNYRKWIEENYNNSQLLSATTFKSILKEENIEIWQPKKDQCDTCISYNQGNISEETYMAHIDLKNKARQEKENDKDEASKSSNKIVMITV
ncbi:Hypothetical predicted protein [Paramuricea clavata]|uniref:Uncharacterized protein n=1 Tax=Paramuricea clavata TaxID=317549 RepID=A0A7D9ENB0_PARCT|nr:Hypothetical predicted protein [Paramuricea clavata]